MKAPNIQIKGDKVIWVVALLLSIFSVLGVYSSTGSLAFRYQGGNTEYYMLKHLFIVLIGLVMMYMIHNMRYTYFSRIAQLLFYISIPLLLFTLLQGTNVNQASRWLTIPILGITFQSSDIAKLAMILYLARLLALKQDSITDLKAAFVPLIVPVGIVSAMIMPANLSTALLVLGSSMMLMFVGRVPLKYIGASFAVMLVVGMLFILVASQMPGKSRVGTWSNRIENFFSDSEDDDYQALQAKIAIANGGIWGKMPGNSTQRNFLPHPYSDFIYALIVEEYGLLGGIFILMLYLILLYRGIRVAARSPGSFGAFLSIGLIFILVFQALINMGVASGLLPVTGQPLPLISMGGTSIWFSCISLGIILSVSKSNDENLKDQQHEQAKA